MLKSSELLVHEIKHTHNVNVFTFTRVNPIGFDQSVIKIDNEINQIDLLDSSGENKKFESWVVGENCDLSKFTINKIKDTIFAVQSDVWELIREKIIYHFESDNAYYLSILLLGCESSGKSYTLFGTNKPDDFGILNRCVEFLFSSHSNNSDNNNQLKSPYTSILVSMFLIYREQIIDILNPPHSYATEDNIFHSSSLGTILFPLKQYTASSITECNNIINLGLKALSFMLYNTSDMINIANIVVSLDVISSDCIHKIEFIETADIFSADYPHHKNMKDHFIGQSQSVWSNHMLFSTFDNINNNNDNKNNSDNNNTEQKELQLSESILKYMLQGVLAGNVNTTNKNNNNEDIESTTSTSSLLVIGCIKPDKSYFYENKSCLDFMNQLESLSESGKENEDENKHQDQKVRVPIINSIQVFIDNCEHELKELSDLLNNEIINLTNPVYSSEVLDNNSILTNTTISTNENVKFIESVKGKIDYYSRKKYFLSNKLTILNEIINNKKSEEGDNNNNCSFMEQNKYIIYKINDYLISRGLDGISDNNFDNFEKKNSDEMKPFLTLVSPYNITTNYLKFPLNDGYSILRIDKIDVFERTNIQMKSVSDLFTDIVNESVVEAEEPLNNDSNSYKTTEAKDDDKNDLINSPMDTSRNHFKRREDMEYLTQYEILTKSGLIPENKEATTITEQVDTIDDAASIQSKNSNNSKQSRVAKFRNKQQQVKESKVNIHTYTLHNNNSNNPYCKFLGDLSMYAIIVHSVTGIKLVPASWHLFSSVRITNSSDSSILTLNGKSIPDKFDSSTNSLDGIDIHDGDILQIGFFQFIKFNIPSGKNNNNKFKLSELTTWQSCLIKSFSQFTKSSLLSTYLQNKRQIAHLDVERELNAITKMREKTRLMKIQSFIPEEVDIESLYSRIPIFIKFKIGVMLLLSKFVTYCSFNLRRCYICQCVFRPSLNITNFNNLGRDDGYMEDIIDKCSVINDFISIFTFETDELDLKIESNNNNKMSWYFIPSQFIHRSLCIRDMLTTFNDVELCNNDLFKIVNLYPGNKDPFVDIVKDELIGVSFLHTDPMQYLLDIDDSLKIINFNGDIVGYLKVSLRSWIDIVEPIPPYITVDLEVNISEHINKQLVTRVYFEFFSNLPNTHCSDSYIYFKFMRQFPVYLTPRCLGTRTNAIIDHTVQIEETITTDLVEFIKTGTIEFEVFGKKKSSLTFNNNKYNEDNKNLYRVGEINYYKLLNSIPESNANDDNNNVDVEKDNNINDYKTKNEILMKQIASLKSELDNKNKLLKKTTKINDNIKTEKNTIVEMHMKEISDNNEKLKTLMDKNNSLSSKITKLESEKNVKTSKNSSSCLIQ